MQPATEPSSEPVVYNRVLSLSLSHFRNYHQARVEAQAPILVLLGPNGAGKTNALEAISLLTPGRGLRRAIISDIDNVAGKTSWAISAEISGAKGPVSVGTGRDPQGEDLANKRIVKIDGKTSRGQAELGRVFSALWLTPQMDTLFIEGGTARRKFLDRLVFSFDGEHATRLNAYEFAMRERNRLLADGQPDPVWLSALEQKMAEQGLAIAVARSHAVMELNKAMHLAGHSFPQAQITLIGAVETALEQGSALMAEEKFRELLAANRGQDGGAGRALTGIHRTQIDVIHVRKNMKAEQCSSGEQKALLVSIILAQTRAGLAWHGLVPVLLLDEVAAHLDFIHRGELFAELSDIGAQAWLTGTDREIFAGIQGQFLSVESGKIIP